LGGVVSDEKFSLFLQNLAQISMKTTLAKKWGDRSLVLGWVAIPSSLLFLQGQLGITPTGMNILLNLVMHWWGDKENPHPSQASLAMRMGVSERTIQREINALVEKGLIKKKGTPSFHSKYRGRNLYDLSPLVSMLNEEAIGLKANLRKSKVTPEEDTSTFSDD
jgi:predicted transcriptional regulator